MPNRILKESVCYSENIDKLSQFQENFFYRLIVNCDDYGRMDARPKVLAAKLFPLRDIRTHQITDALRALSSAELVILYEKDGHPFLQMKTWDRHQQIRSKKSKYPSLDDSCNQMISDDINCNQMISDDIKCPRNPIQSVSISVSNAESNARANDDFDRFWLAYPRHEAKQNAMKAFEKINPDGELLERIIEAVERWKKTEQWTEKGGQFVPYAASWLNGRRWEDEIPEKRKAGPVKVVVAQDYDQRSYDDIQSQIDADMDQEMERWRQSRGGA